MTKQYLIDLRTMATFRVKARTKKEALEILKVAARDIDLQMSLDAACSVEIVNITDQGKKADVVAIC